MQERYVNALVEMLGAEGGDRWWLRISGHCMAPLLTDGQRVLVQPARWYWPGDILVFHSLSGNGLIAHRLIGAGWRRGRWRLLTRADNAPNPDFALPPARVLGRVVVPRVAPRQRLAAVARFLAFAWARLRRA